MFLDADDDDEDGGEDDFNGIVSHKYPDGGGVHYKFSFAGNFVWAEAAKFPQYGKQINAYNKKHQVKAAAGSSSTAAGYKASRPATHATRCGSQAVTGMSTARTRARSQCHTWPP